MGLERSPRTLRTVQLLHAGLAAALHVPWPLPAVAGQQVLPLAQGNAAAWHVPDVGCAAAGWLQALPHAGLLRSDRRQVAGKEGRKDAG